MWLALLIPLVPWLAKRILVSLGFGIITYAATSAALDVFTTAITNNLSATAGTVLQMATLFGAIDAIGIILGALSTNLTLNAIRKFALM